MSTTAKKTIAATLYAAGATDYLENWGLSDYSATATKERGMSYHPTENRIVVKANGTDERVAWMSDLNRFGSYRGVFDASVNRVPKTSDLTALLGDQSVGQPINAGDEITISVAGTISGLAYGSENLLPGDTLRALTDGATAAADFMSLPRKEATAPTVGREGVTGLALVADTALATTAATLTTVDCVSVRNSTGDDITASLVVNISTNIVTLTSSIALTGVTINMIGEMAAATVVVDEGTIIP